MTNKKRIASSGFDSKQSITKIQLSTAELSNLKPVSMDKIFESIKNIEKDVKGFQDQLEYQTSPNVGDHWYRLGNASAKEVNQSLDKVVTFVKNSLKLVSDTDKSQSENIKNLCVLVSLLAIAEAKLYYQFDELSSDSDTAIDIMAEYERELQEIANNGDDTQKNVNKIAKTLGKILEEKNKEVINIRARFEKWRKDEAEQRSLLFKLLDEHISAAKSEAATFTADEIKKSRHEIESNLNGLIRLSQKAAIDAADEKLKQARTELEIISHDNTKHAKEEAIRSATESLDKVRKELSDEASELANEAMEAAVRTVAISLGKVKEELAIQVREDANQAKEAAIKTAATCLSVTQKELESQALAKANEAKDAAIKKASEDLEHAIKETIALASEKANEAKLSAIQIASESIAQNRREIEENVTRKMEEQTGAINYSTTDMVDNEVTSLKKRIVTSYIVGGLGLAGSITSILLAIFNII